MNYCILADLGVGPRLDFFVFPWGRHGLFYVADEVSYQSVKQMDASDYHGVVVLGLGDLAGES
jgi:hypothetical protein